MEHITTVEDKVRTTYVKHAVLKMTEQELEGLAGLLKHTLVTKDTSRKLFGIDIEKMRDTIRAILNRDF